MDKKVNIKVKFPEDLSIVKYSNLTMVTHLPEEFVLNFAQMTPGRANAEVISQVILTPKNAKAFLASLAQNVEAYEKKFGEIELSNMNPTTIQPPEDIQ